MRVCLMGFIKLKQKLFLRPTDRISNGLRDLTGAAVKKIQISKCDRPNFWRWAESLEIWAFARVTL